MGELDSMLPFRRDSFWAWSLPDSLLLWSSISLGFWKMEFFRVIFVRRALIRSLYELLDRLEEIWPSAVFIPRSELPSFRA